MRVLYWKGGELPCNGSVREGIYVGIKFSSGAWRCLGGTTLQILDSPQGPAESRRCAVHRGTETVKAAGETCPAMLACAERFAFEDLVP